VGSEDRDGRGKMLRKGGGGAEGGDGSECGKGKKKGWDMVGPGEEGKIMRRVREGARWGETRLGEKIEAGVWGDRKEGLKGVGTVGRKGVRQKEGEN